MLIIVNLKIHTMQVELGRVSSIDKGGRKIERDQLTDGVMGKLRSLQIP